MWRIRASCFAWMASTNGMLLGWSMVRLSPLWVGRLYLTRSDKEKSTEGRTNLKSKPGHLVGNERATRQAKASLYCSYGIATQLYGWSDPMQTTLHLIITPCGHFQSKIMVMKTIKFAWQQQCSLKWEITEVDLNKKLKEHFYTLFVKNSPIFGRWRENKMA